VLQIIMFEGGTAVTTAILGYVVCFSLGTFVGFLAAAFFANASDREVRP
jgi:uncharacterized membrane protein